MIRTFYNVVKILKFNEKGLQNWQKYRYIKPNSRKKRPFLILLYPTPMGLKVNLFIHTIHTKR